MRHYSVTTMVKLLTDNNIVGLLSFLCFFLGAIYPYPAFGSPYQTADHFWPFQNISGGLIDDVQGAAHTIVYNGGRIKKVLQLGTSLYLDGKDDWVDTGGFNADCVSDPSRCKQGFTLAFWIKVYGSGYIMSSGSFTNSQRGPGFRLVYDTKIKGFEFILETSTKRWRVHVQADTNKWLHMAFSWKETVGIEYYEDGNLSTLSGPKPFFLSARPKRFTPVITLARPSSLHEMNNFGYFEISQFAIWMKWLSSSDVAGVYTNSVVYNQDTAVCCYFKSIGICTKNPCYDPKRCKRIDDTHRCLCPRVSQRLKTCKEKIQGSCVDKIKSCNIYSSQPKYCKHRKMRDVCPRSCSYCAPGSSPNGTNPIASGGSSTSGSGGGTSTNVQGTSPDSKSSTSDVMMSTDVYRATPFISPTVSPSASHNVPDVLASTNVPLYRNMSRTLPKGKDCNSIQCPYYSRCFQRKGYAECKCRDSCTYEYAPVCGTNSKTYINLCVLKQDSCFTGQWIRLAKKGSCGSRYPNAAHYWPFNGTTTPKKVLPDLRGKSMAVTLNGVRTTRAEQLGTVMSLDGSDDNIAIQGISSRCIKDPTYCSKGLAVAFWIKYFKGEAILSSGLFIDDRPGPGFKFICSSCSGLEPTRSAEDTKGKQFTVILSTQTQEWRVILDFLPSSWFHFAFTWHQDHGLKVYRNGKIIAKSTEAKTVPLRPAKFKIDTIISIGKPDSLHNIFNHGKFDIGHLVIWPYELSAYEVEVAFLTVLAKTTKSLICCHFKKADPCLANPCFDGASCRSIDEKFECICPDVGKGPCDKDTCRDRADECSIYKGNVGYCRKNGMASVCPKTCNLCGNKGILPTLQTSTADKPRLQTPPTNKPLSTPQLNDGTSPRLSPTKNTKEPTDSSRTRSKGIISILGTESWTMDTSQVGKSSETTGKIDPFKISLYTQRGATSANPSELYSKNEKTRWPNDKTVSKSEVLPSLKPSRSVKTLALSPTPNIGTNKPTISSPSTGSLVVARETITRPVASPSFIDPNVLSTSGPRVRTTPRATRTQNHRVQTLSPTPTPYPPVKQQHRCPLAKGSKQECICMNCEGNTSPGLLCCIDQLDPNNLDNGVVLLMSSLSMVEFLSKVSSLRYLAGEVIKDACSKSPCFQDNVARKKRSNSDWEYGTPIKSWDGSPITPTNTLNPDSRRDAQPSSMAPRVQKPINVNIVMFKIGQHPAQQHQIYTAFYVSLDGANETQIVQPGVLETIMRSKRDLFKEKLNISFDRITSWRLFSRTFSIGPRAMSPTAVNPSSSTVLTAAGNPNIEGQEGRNSTTNMSKSTFIIVLVTGIGGFVVLAIIIIYMLFKFLRRMKGEFVPDKAYPEEQKTDVGSDQLIPSFIDPSAPRITDVPKKTVRSPAHVNGNAGGGGGPGGGAKKAKKPMGVKVTYKPPKWD